MKNGIGWPNGPLPAIMERWKTGCLKWHMKSKDGEVRKESAGSCRLIASGKLGGN